MQGSARENEQYGVSRPRRDHPIGLRPITNGPATIRRDGCVSCTRSARGVIRETAEPVGHRKGKPGALLASQERMETQMVTMEKVRESVLEPTSWTFGGVAAYHAEIENYTRQGFTRSDHDVADRDGSPFTVTALYAGGVLTKVYEL
jgi:hypothetical protein